MDPSHTLGVDAHCHLDGERFDVDRREVLFRAKAVGIGTAILAAGDPRHWERVRRTAQVHDLPFALGIHPWWPDPTYLGRLPAALVGACAIGETGLDYVRAKDKPTRDLQHDLLDAHLDLATATGLPMVFHAVRAVSPLLDIIGNRPIRGMIHGFVRGDVKRAMAAGLYLSFGPDLVRSTAAITSAIACPLERLLLESDAPDRPLHGERGEPADVRAIAEFLAPRKGISPTELLQHTGHNARTLFNLDRQ